MAYKFLLKEFSTGSETVPDLNVMTLSIRGRKILYAFYQKGDGRSSLSLAGEDNGDVYLVLSFPAFPFFNSLSLSQIEWQ